jgi:hypothetical protein
VNPGVLDFASMLAACIVIFLSALVVIAPAWIVSRVFRIRLLTVFMYGVATLGAIALTYNYVQKWGWPATVWMLGAPAVYGLYHRFTAHAPPPAASTPPPR